MNSLVRRGEGELRRASAELGPYALIFGGLSSKTSSFIRALMVHGAAVKIQNRKKNKENTTEGGQAKPDFFWGRLYPT